MEQSELQYLPLTPAYFSLLVGIFLILLLLIQFRILRYAYMQLGVSSGAAVALLFGSLAGSYFNIPIAQLPQEHVESAREVYFFGMRYVVPVVVQWPGTIIAVNIGGAVIPIAVSIYLLARYQLWARALIGVAVVAAACNWMAQPIPGVGIALPVFFPALVTSVTALALTRRYAAQVAYIAGSLGTLIGADLLNLWNLRGLGAPVASIGGAGTFDGIFLVGIVAVLLASLVPSPHPASS